MNPLPPKVNKAALILLIASVLTVVGIFLWLQPASFSASINSFEQAANNVLTNTFKGETLIPPPLRSTENSPDSTLTSAGVFADTNTERAQNGGLPALTKNATLTAIAEKKLRDMFDKQYFEHTSPSGVGAADLAQQAGYDYIIIGENLALGNFKDDQALLDAWMASPGHRANILNNRYQELGVAVGQDVFEGRTTWIAVQEFGLPISACDQPSKTLHATIDTNRAAIATMEQQLTTQKAAIDAMSVKTGPDYDQAVNTYNALVRKYNTAVLSLKAQISTYNTQVQVFNACAKIGTTTPEVI